MFNQKFWLVSVLFCLLQKLAFMMFVLEAPPAVFLLDLHVKVLGPSIESMWLEEICWSILNFRTFSVSDISREANKGAVVLAKLDQDRVFRVLYHIEFFKS
jgi:hypothetical protein